MNSTTADISDSKMDLSTSYIKPYESFMGSFSADLERQIIDLFYQNEMKKVKEILGKYPEMNIFEINEGRNYNLLHITCLNNNYQMIQLMMKFIDEQARDFPNKALYEELVRNWINGRNNEGFTPIHYASYRGNIKIIMILEQRGAKVSEKNNQGLNVMHMASQGDQPISLAYFRDKGFSIDALDYKKSTPLHWASFLGCENSVNFLTSWGCILNQADEEAGLTPLHLGVISGNSKIVRKLLLRGADRNVQDKNGKTPRDLAKENDFENIYKMLNHRDGWTERCNIKSALAPAKRKLHSLFGFIFMLVACNAAVILFVYPYTFHYAWWVTHIVSFSLSSLFFLLSWFIKPGYLSRNPQISLMELLQENDPYNLCPDCEIIKPSRSKHCEICKKCVKVYDHHCPWINNCVGANNHKYFFFFIILIWLHLLFLLIMLSRFLLVHEVQYKSFLEFTNINEDSFFFIKLSVSIFNMGIGAFFFFPLLYLIYIHIGNFLMNKTTSERFGHSSGQPSGIRKASTTSSVIEDKNEKNKEGLDQRENLSPDSGRTDNNSDYNASLVDLNINKVSMKGSFKGKTSVVWSQYPRNCYNMCMGNAHEPQYENVSLLDNFTPKNFD